MNIYDEIDLNLKKKRKILFSHDSFYLKELINTIRSKNHKVLILWSFDLTLKIKEELKQKIDKSDLLDQAYFICDEWSKGRAKMPQAKKLILECHALCKELEDEGVNCLIHAFAQGISSVHVKEHALGIVYYQLTEKIINNEKKNWQSILNELVLKYAEKLAYWEVQEKKIIRDWADFLNKA